MKYDFVRSVLDSEKNGYERASWSSVLTSKLYSSYIEIWKEEMFETEGVPG